MSLGIDVKDFNSHYLGIPLKEAYREAGIDEKTSIESKIIFFKFLGINMGIRGISRAYLETPLSPEEILKISEIGYEFVSGTYKESDFPDIRTFYPHEFEEQPRA